jgi:regulator of protease activity HflC (stomatin/prohibitin superfamily)
MARPSNSSESRPPGQNLAAMFQYFKGTLILALITLVLLLSILLVGLRFGEVNGTQVGALLNNINGEVQVITNAGTHVYNGITKTFHVLDKTVQQVEMSQDNDDELKIKTVDGSNVQLDLNVMYSIMLEPDSIRSLLKDSGLGESYKRKWIRDYGRSICRGAFGELTTEEFYDPAKRQEKALKAMDELNELLNPHSLTVIQVNPKNFRFYTEYEEKIKEKKLADQSVEEEISKARAASQVMERKRVEAQKEMEVEIQTVKGAMEELIVTANADAERVIEESRAYAVTTRVGAEAELYTMKSQADAILAKSRAEAEGLTKMAEALKGEGGLNLVKMEYAKRLATMKLTGQPFVVSGVTERFEHFEEPGSRRGLSPAPAPAQGKENR